MSFEPDPRHRRVVIDTNALYAMPLADTLLRAADGELFDFLWTADILRELRATMLRQGFPADAVQRRITSMRRAFRDTEVSGYEAIIPRLRLPDADDRHVLAAAIHADAWAIVTANMQDFPADMLAEYALQALTPADFVVGLIREFPEQVLAIVREQAAALRQPPMTFDSLVDTLAVYAPAFGEILRDLDARDRSASAVVRRLREDIAPKVAADPAYQNARENTPHTARMAHDQALNKVMQHLLREDTQVYKQFVENESFRRFVADVVFELTSR